MKRLLIMLSGLAVIVGCIYLAWSQRWRLTPFPSNVDRAQLKMKLRRTTCFGSCPAYSVVVLGDGTVRYCGAAHVHVPGQHTSHISPQAVTDLLEDFRRARFIAAQPEYRFPISDWPTNVLTLKIGTKKTTVVDYAGRRAGMPSEITTLEHQFDEIAGTDQWVKGRADTMEELPNETFHGCPNDF